MTIAAWNILHGGGANRTPEIGLALRALAPDLVVLSEFRPGRGGQLRAQLADGGLVHQLASPVDPSRNGVLIASRYELRASDERAPGSAGRWLAADVPRLGMLVCGVHAPDDTTPAAKSAYWRFLVDLARKRRGERVIFVGDVNSGRRGQDGAGFANEALLGTILSLGFVDAWRNKHPSSRERSWVSRLGEGRLDAAYLSAALADALVECRFEHGVREAGLSDHSALTVTLSLEAAPDERGRAGLFTH